MVNIILRVFKPKSINFKNIALFFLNNLQFVKTLYFYFLYIYVKMEEVREKKRTKERPTDPPNFCPLRANKHLFIFGLNIILYCTNFVFSLFIVKLIWTKLNWFWNQGRHNTSAMDTMHAIAWYIWRTV